MNQTMYMATRDMIRILVERHIHIRKSTFWARMHHSISMKILQITH